MLLSLFEVEYDKDEDPDKANSFINGRILESKTGKVYKDKAQLSVDGKHLNMRSYVGISALGRNRVWICTDSANP